MALENSGPQPVPAQIGALNPPPSPHQVVFDPTPHINAVEQELKDWLNRPTQDLMRELGLNPGDDDHPRDHDEADPAAASPGMGGGAGLISSLMGPMVSMAGMLGTGIFQGLDPSQLLDPLTQAFQQGAQSLQGMMGQMGEGSGGWLGNGAIGTATKAGQLGANGAAIGAQAGTVGSEGVEAGTTCQQNYARMMELLHEIESRLAALSGGVPFTLGPMGETGEEGQQRTIELITELEAMLTAQAAQTALSGAPLALTSAPQAASGAMGPMMQAASGLAGPAMKAATAPLAMGSKALGQGVQQATQIGSQMGSQLGQAGNNGVPKPAPTAMPAHLAHGTSTAGTGGPKPGSTGGGATPKPSAPTNTLVSQNTTTTTNATQSAAMRGAVSSAGLSSGMGGAPGTGGAAGAAGRAGAGANGNGGHSAASFLHTSDQGDEIVGDLGNVAPPVIGAAGIDPNSPDVELRI